MFLRMSYVSGDASRIDDLITYVRTVVKPATDELPGNQGLAMWVNRGSGDALVASVWDDAATMHTSEQAVLKLRDDAAGIIGGNAVVERYESVLVDGGTPHQVGNVMRLVRTHADPTMIDANIAWTQQAVVPLARKIDGYLSLAVGVDRMTGAAVSSTTYRDASAVAIEADVMAHLQGEATARGIQIDSMTDYEVAIVGIRTPMPQQRSIDVTESLHSAER